ncbi:MAG: hypothetical protein U0869_13970 [Chloroflexota bacterium]
MRRRHDELEAAWWELQDATPAGWIVGRPYFHDERNEWEQYARDTIDRPPKRDQIREWIAIGPTEIECVREMARCMREIAEGRPPR